ncbi:PD-(D/E)XK nuclease family protein [Oricola nitratireducens]|uniref:PD-(D/E)XK nuclease family protein n=1 Tax=Oricola nitratireducens TaxID=2775868 RepID=UPI001866FCC9|nr:PD-(D/E)XK nuclease family protein [Oricola nitratireducens]
MELVFDLWADRGAFPDHGGGPQGALGQPVVGPLGLVDTLETMLGLGAPPTAHVVRVAHFQAILEGIVGAHFWSRSLATDPWATARTVLSWRDELVGFGWRAEDDWDEPRLSSLAQASRAAGTMPPGFVDRVAAVLAELEDRTTAPVATIRLADPRELCPAPVRRLLDRLESLGCALIVIEPVASASSETALGKLQRWMLGAPLPERDTDKSLALATASSEPLAAEIAGQWIAGQPPDKTLALIAQDGDSDLLDHALRLSGQPRAGRSRTSVHRGSLQLLLLAFKARWEPFDAGALMEILVFPGSPVAPRAARRLAAALEEAPGRGGPEWEAAWAAIAAAEEEHAGDDPDASAKIAPKLERWRAWTDGRLADPVSGMPLVEALYICDLVIEWAARRFAVSDDRLHAATVTLGTQVRAALTALGRDPMPRLLVERVIDQALDQGEANPSALTEAAAWRCVVHPGAIWAPVDTLLWWNFKATTEGSERAPWSACERAALAAAGCPADEFTRAARAASTAWERAILHARERLVLIAGGPDCEDEDSLHPLAHRLKPALDLLLLPLRLEIALVTPRIEIAGTAIARSTLDARQLPDAQPAWLVPPGFAERLAAHTESATSLESLFSCQLLWALRHVARLRPGRVRSIPDGNQLLGNLAHAIAREVFPPGQPPAPEEAEALAEDLLESRIDQLAAPLRQPELADALTLARRRLPAAMAGLARCLAENGLVVEGTEAQVSGTFETLLALRGAVDLVARDADANAVIVDLKWTHSERARVDELATGRAVQLATYGALVAGNTPYRAGYYLLNQRQFATLAGSGLVGRSVEGARTFGETWEAILAGWRTWREVAADGQLLAAGVEGVADLLPADLPLVRDVHCEWCDYATLCRVRGLA